MQAWVMTYLKLEPDHKYPLATHRLDMAKDRTSSIDNPGNHRVMLAFTHQRREHYIINNEVYIRVTRKEAGLKGGKHGLKIYNNWKTFSLPIRYIQHGNRYFPLTWREWGTVSHWLRKMQVPQEVLAEASALALEQTQ